MGYRPPPRRRREDLDLDRRMVVVEAVQQEHRQLFSSLDHSLAALVRIESENAVARAQSADNGKELRVIQAELPTLRITRLLVFTAAIAVLGSSLAVAWGVFRDAAEGQRQHMAGKVLSAVE